MPLSTSWGSSYHRYSKSVSTCSEHKEPWYKRNLAQRSRDGPWSPWSWTLASVRPFLALEALGLQHPVPQSALLPNTNSTSWRDVVCLFILFFPLFIGPCAFLSGAQGPAQHPHHSPVLFSLAASTLHGVCWCGHFLMARRRDMAPPPSLQVRNGAAARSVQGGPAVRVPAGHRAGRGRQQRPRAGFTLRHLPQPRLRPRPAAGAHVARLRDAAGHVPGDRGGARGSRRGRGCVARRSALGHRSSTTAVLVGQGILTPQVAQVSAGIASRPWLLWLLC